MNFKNRLTTDNLLTSTNLVTAVVVIMTVVLIWRSCSEEKPKAPEMATEKKVLRVTMPEEKPPLSAEPVGTSSIESKGISLESIIAGAGFRIKGEQKKDDETAQKGKIAETVKEEKASTREETVTLTKLEKPAVAEEIKKEAVKEAPAIKEGIYKVIKGETLYDIAGKKQVYGDHLKWTSLYRHNIETFAKAGVILTDKFPETALPAGITLKYVTDREAGENAKRFSNKTYVVNAISTRNSGTIVLPAISLIKSGYDVYIVSAEIKGKNWLRLRSGFYENREKAIAASKKIMNLLNINDAWIAKAEKEEFNKVAGY